MSIDRLATSFFNTTPATERFLRTHPAVGIELEYENFGSLRSAEVQEGNYWVATLDGSLRNGGVELVSRPLLLPDIDEALSRAEAIVTASGATATTRCGLHMHMNMRPYSIGQVWSLTCLYALIEPSIYQMYAVGREDSMFGVPLWLNTMQQNALFADICTARSRPVPRATVGTTSKYSAFNLSALQVFGTIEMRQPYCTNDFAAIRSWTDFVVRMYMTGVSYDDPIQVLGLYEQEGLRGLQEQLFGITNEVGEELQELAEDAAYMTAGFVEPSWEELTWDIPVRRTA